MNKLSIIEKNKIRRAVITTNIICDEEDRNHEVVLAEELQNAFPTKEVHSGYKKNELTPDILIQGLCVIEVKHRRKPNLNSDDRSHQIQKYVRTFELPGVFVNFDLERDPYVNWYAFEETSSGERRAVKENEGLERINSKFKQEGAVLSSPVNERQEQPTEESTSGLGLGSTIIIAGAAALVGLIAFGATRRNRND